METHQYICNYCQKEFVPTRRRVQKYCSDSCRSGAFNLRKQALSTPKNQPVATKNQLIETDKKPAKTKVEQMSTSGVGNAVVGTMIVDGLKTAFTQEENKAATKGDLSILYEKIGRYHRITNLSQNESGALPYFDMYINEVVYIGGNDSNFKTESLIA